VAVGFHSRDATWLDLLSRRLSPFQISRPFHFLIEQETTGPTPVELPSALAIHLEPQELEDTPSGFVIRTPTSVCEVDLEARRARVAGPRALYPLDNLLRHLLPFLYSEGLVLHGAAFEHGGSGFVASGPSGSGKTTLSQLAGARALCDELTAIRWESRRARLLALPFWKARPGSAPLEGVLMLRHAQRHRLRRLGSKEAFKRLAPQVLWPLDKSWAVKRTFEYLSRLVEEVPAWELGFAPRSDVWDAIREIG
jgi:hypothetical protein